VENGELYILSCYQPHVNETWYVSERPGQGGKGWGWEWTRDKAVPLSDYWRRRFMADMRYVGRKGQAFAVSVKVAAC
jgi:hypothetical protein